MTRFEAFKRGVYMALDQMLTGICYGIGGGIGFVLAIAIMKKALN